MSDKKEESQPSRTAEPAAKAGGGIKPMLPLIIAVVLMPVVAYAMTAFVLVPKLKSSAGAPASPEEGKHGGDAPSGGDHGAAPAKGEHGAAEAKTETKGDGKARQSVQLSKMIVNVAGTMGTRYLMTSLTLVGTHKDFKKLVEDNKDQLLDLASGTLGAKTIPDLEKPGARNQIRSELLTIFNNALGSSTVQEIYITEMAIQ
jgi:flagellar protein FliL